MILNEVHVEGYRSVLKLRLKLGRVNVLVGPNGCGKTNLYRALYLLHAAACGELAPAIVEEGGMPSVLGAGDRKQGPVRMTLGVEGEPLAYELVCGLPKLSNSAFGLDPEIKGESVWFVERGKRLPLLERERVSAWARDADGRRASYPMALMETESVLAGLREPHRFPQIAVLREALRTWRFSHQFRTDAGSPGREPQVCARTFALAHDGRDLAAALQTIREIGDPAGLDEAIEAAFPGAELLIDANGARFRMAIRFPEFRRAFEARELSDGTLRYLCLLAALLSPRPPALMAFNEPETSLHPDLLRPLGALFARAARDTQLWITTHSETLARFIEEASGAAPVRLEKVNGQTRVAGQRLVED